MLRLYGEGKLNDIISKAVLDCNAYTIRQRKESDGESPSDDNDDDYILLPHFTCHNLRHTFATRLCEAGVNIKVIQATMGHANIDTTLTIYTDAKEEIKQREFKQLNKLDSYYFDLLPKSKELTPKMSSMAKQASEVFDKMGGILDDLVFFSH